MGVGRDDAEACPGEAGEVQPTPNERQVITRDIGPVPTSAVPRADLAEGAPRASRGRSRAGGGPLWADGVIGLWILRGRWHRAAATGPHGP
jgi:hypothetical protein